MNKAILSTEYPQFARRLQELGYKIIPSEEIPCEMPYERRHADLQCLIISNTVFALSCCEGLINALSGEYKVIRCGEGFGVAYPDNVCLNALQLGDKLICRIPSLETKVKAYCEQHNIELLHVNQGYAKCSCAVIGDQAVITADKGIAVSLEQNNIDVLRIGQGSVRLEGAEYGFIGGATGYDPHNNTLYICGDIRRHPDYNRIKGFCDQHNTRIFCLSDDEITDIGGIMLC